MPAPPADCLPADCPSASCPPTDCTSSDRPAIVGVLLAGGQARRMGGGDKGLQLLAGRSLLDHVVDRLRPQVDHLILNAGGDPDRFARWRLPVVADAVAGSLGPLAGILTGLEWAQQQAPDSRWLLSVPTDAPFLPLDLADRLLQAVRDTDGADMACALSGGRRHPVVGLWPVSLAADLRSALIDEDIRKIDRWTARYSVAVADFSTQPLDPFFNANRPDDLVQAAALLRSLPEAR